MRSVFTILLCTSFSFLMAQVDSTLVIDPDSIDVNVINNGLTFTASELADQTDDQSFSGLLQSNRDVFMRSAGFNFGAARFRVRGMDNRNFQVLLNGVEMNDPELGFAIWANWGGLNDITRFPETGVGVSANDYAFGSIQGFSNVDLSASSKRAGTRVSYSASNRTYTNRLMLTHSTGMMDNGLAVSASISARWADEGYVQGTSYSNLAYFLSIEKKVNEQHTLGLIGFGSPSLRGRGSINTDEAYAVRDDNYYNANWGFQQGEKRNSRMRYSHKPTIMAWHEYKLSEKTTIKTNAYTQFGQFYNTRLDWVDANDPRPDYYRNLPSYLEFIGEPDGIAALQNQWANDPSFYQVNWDSFYQANEKNLFTVNNANGTGETIQGNRSKYIVEAAHSDPFLLGLNATVKHNITESKHVTGGFNLNTYTSDNYRVVDDFLGGDFWLDINRFAEGAEAGSQGASNDLNRPNAVIESSDDRYGYSYKMERRNLDLFGQYSEETDKFDYFIGGQMNAQTIWRDGDFKNELFADNSEGESERSSFLTGGVKAGLNYKLTGRHFVSVNAAVMSRAPLLRNAFLSPRTRNTLVPNLTTEKISSFDVNYQIRFPRFKARATAYAADIQDQINIFTFFSEGSNDLINLVTSGIDQSFRGIEIGFEANATSTLTINGALGHGQHLYTSRPNVTRVIDETDTQAPTEQAYLLNYRVGRTPQTAANLGFTYRAPQFYFFGFDYSHFGNSYIDPLSTRRTISETEGLVTSDPSWGRILEQTKLDDGGTLNFFAGKSWRFDRKYFLLLTCNVSNVLNNQDFNTGGFEQGRPSVSQLDLFDNRYGYLFGRTYFAMLRFSF